MNLFDLSGKVALVTGSTKGIGEAIVHRMAEHGANVVVSSRKADACEKVAADINKAQGRRQHRSPATSTTRSRSKLWCSRRARNGAASTCWSATRRSTRITARRWYSRRSLRQIMGANIAPTTGSASRFCRRWWSARMARSSSSRRSAACAAHRARRLLHLEGRRLAARAQHRGRYGPHNIRANCIAPGLIKTDFARRCGKIPKS